MKKITISAFLLLFCILANAFLPVKFPKNYEVGQETIQGSYAIYGCPTPDIRVEKQEVLTKRYQNKNQDIELDYLFLKGNHPLQEFGDDENAYLGLIQYSYIFEGKIIGERNTPEACKGQKAAVFEVSSWRPTSYMPRILFFNDLKFYLSAALLVLASGFLIFSFTITIFKKIKQK